MWSVFGTISLAIISLIGFSNPLLAYSPLTFSYQGRLYDATGTAPMVGNFDVTFTILSPDGNCILYEEQFLTLDMTASAGTFAEQIGTGAPTANNPGNTMLQVFSNGNTPIAAFVNGSCPGGTWSPTLFPHPEAEKTRLLRITVFDGVTTTVLTPDQTITSVPTAMIAEQLSDIPTDDIRDLLDGSHAVYGNFVSANDDWTAGPYTPQVIGTHGLTIEGILTSEDDLILNSLGNPQLLIGASTPDAGVDFEIERAAPLMRLSSTTNAGANNTTIEFVGDATGTNDVRAKIEVPDNANEMHFYVGDPVTPDVEILHIDSTGLHLAPAKTIYSNSISMSDSTYLGLSLHAADPNTATWGNAEKGQTWFNSTENAIKYWDGDSTEVITASAGSNVLSDDDGDTKIQVEESADEDMIRFDTDGAERMVIDNLGNVGIGAAPNSDKLNVAGSIYSTTSVSAAVQARLNGTGLVLARDAGVRWNLSTNDYANNPDVGIVRTAPANLKINDGAAGSGALEVATVYGGSGIGSTLDLVGTNNVAPLNAHITLNASGEGNVGIGTSTPQSKLSIHATIGSNAEIGLTDDDVAHGMTALAPTNVAGTFSVRSPTAGGAHIYGFNDDGADYPLSLYGVLGSATPVASIAAVGFGATKKDGATVQALANNETAYQFYNYTAPILTMMGSGNVGIGTITPTGKLDVEGGTAFLPAPEGAPVDGNFANNQYSIYSVDNGASDPDVFLKVKDLSGEIVNLNLSAAVAGAGDNMGDHVADMNLDMATFNIELNGNYLSGDGGDEGVFVDADGKVGIGTGAPGNRLSVGAPTTADALADMMVGTSANSQKGIVVQGLAGQTANLQEWQTSTGAVGLTISADGSSLVRSTSGGVQIGASATSGGNNIPLTLKSDGGGYPILLQNGNTVSAAVNSNKITLDSGIALGWTSGAVGFVNPLDSGISRVAPGVIGFGTGATGAINGTIAAANVGIGTSTPAARLTVVGNGSNAISITNSTADGVIKGAGIVGERYLNASSPFGVIGMYDNGIGERAVTVGNGTPGASALYFYTQPFASEAASAPANIRMYVGPTGDIGFGNYDPTSRMDLSGAFTIRGMAAPAVSPADQGRIYFDSGTDKLMVSLDGDAYAELVTTASLPGSSLSSLTAATATNTIDNDDFAQTWDWSTLDTEVAMTLNANAITSGSALKIASSSLAFTGTLSEVSLTGDDAANTGVLQKLSVSGTTSAAVPLMITNLGTGNSLRINDETGDTDATPFVIDASGNVGIGTPTPGSNLHLVGTMRLGTNTTFRESGFKTATLDLADGSFVFNRDYFQLVDVPDMNVGNFNINGADVTSGSYAGGTISLNGGDVSAAAGLNAGSINLAAGVNTVTPALSGSVVLSANGAEAMRVHRDGNVGIGTTTPETKLHVVADWDVTFDRFGTGDGVDLVIRKARGSLGAPANVTDGDFLGGVKDQGYYAGAYRNAAGISFHVDGVPAGTSVPGAISFKTSPAGGTISDRMLIDSDGNVGIGNTDPTSAFDLSGAFTIRGMAAPAVSPADQGRIYFDSGTDKLMVSLDGDAYAELVTTASMPGASLSSLTDATAVNTIDNDDFAQTWNWNSLDTETGMTLGSSSITSGTLHKVTSGSVAFTGVLSDVSLTGDDAANTGVVQKVSVSGTASAATPLMVTNLGAGNSFRVNDATDDADTTPFVIDASGNVGVGVPTPTAKVDIKTPSAGTVGLQITDSSGQSAPHLKLVRLDGIVLAEIGRDDILTNNNTSNGGLKVAKIRTGEVRARYGLEFASDADNISNTSDISFKTALTEKMRILNNGNVGIGVSAPTNLLHVEKQVDAGTLALLKNTSTTGTGVLALDTGNNGQDVLLIQRNGATIGKLSNGGNILNYDSTKHNFTDSGTNLISFDLNSGWTEVLAPITTGMRLGANSATLHLLPDGKVGIGNSSPSEKLEVTGNVKVDGVFRGPATTADDGDEFIDFANSNLRYTAEDCQSFELYNMKDGASYTLAVQGTNVATCSFRVYSDAGVTQLTEHMPQDHGATITGTHTVYTFLVMGNHVYVAWIPGY